VTAIGNPCSSPKRLDAGPRFAAFAACSVCSGSIQIKALRSDPFMQWASNAFAYVCADKLPARIKVPACIALSDVSSLLPGSSARSALEGAARTIGNECRDSAEVPDEATPLHIIARTGTYHAHLPYCQDLPVAFSNPDDTLLPHVRSAMQEKVRIE